MELPKIIRKTANSRLKTNKREKSSGDMISIISNQQKFSQIYKLAGNPNSEVMHNYTTRMKKFSDIFSVNRLVRQTKQEISNRRQVKGHNTPSPTSMFHMRNYKLSYSPIPNHN